MTDSLEVMLARVDERTKAMHATIGRIDEKTERMDSRIDALEKWRSGIVAGISVLIVILTAAFKLG